MKLMINGILFIIGVITLHIGLKTKFNIEWKRENKISKWKIVKLCACIASSCILLFLASIPFTIKIIELIAKEY